MMYVSDEWFTANIDKHSDGTAEIINGATVGSVLGMRGGIDCIDDYWKKPINGKIHTSIFGIGTVDIEEAVEKTLKHIE